MKKGTGDNITKSDATEGKPVWVNNKIYYVSDGGNEKRRNIWVYDPDKKSKTQLTDFTDIDINHMSAGPSELVFQAGGRLYLLNLSNNKYSEVKINVVADISTLMPRTVNVGNNISNFDISPDAKRTVFEARGELFSIPAENGVIINLTKTSGAVEGNPAWSPNGKWLAYWSDESGENEIWLRDNTTGQAKKITDFTKGMGWNLSWSPDSKKIVFINDLQEIKLLNVTDKSAETIDHTTDLTFSNLQGFGVSWSPDNKWIAYSKGTENLNNAIYLYSIENKKLHKATSAYYNDANPVFEPTGKYLFFTTDRSFNPSYSNFDNTWIYPNSTQLAVATLDPSTPALLYAKNDEIKLDTASANKDKAPADTTKKAIKPPTASNKVDPETLERRLEILPVPAGNLGGLFAAEGKLVYMRFPNTGAAAGGQPSIYLYDIDKREEKLLLANVKAYVNSADGKNILARNNRNGFGI